MQDPKTYLTTSAVASRLGKSPDRVRQLARAGELVAAVITSRGDRLYTPAEVTRYEQQRSQKPER